MSSNRILKHLIPVDGQPHDFEAGSILHIAAQTDDAVSVWFMEDSGGMRKRRYTLTAVGTGHTFETGRAPGPLGTWHGAYYGTAVHQPSGLVWHLVGYDVPA